MQLTNSQGHHTARLNRLIQMTLIIGLSLSMLFMITGTALYVLHPPAAGGPAIAAGQLLPGLAGGDPMAFMITGMIVLMVTPAFRVAVAALGYVLDGDWTFALVSLGVAAVLALSVFIGRA
jgi:uncharacterized membrane protein